MKTSIKLLVPVTLITSLLGFIAPAPAQAGFFDGLGTFVRDRINETVRGGIDDVIDHADQEFDEATDCVVDGCPSSSQPDPIQEALQQLLRTKECSGCNLSGTNLRGKDLSNVDLGGANLSGADLSGANLSGAYMRNSNLSNTDLSQSNLSNANLKQADLNNADLHQANLSNADLSRANLNGADLSNAQMGGADLRGATMPDEQL
ncbi:pentapeptide repeat-containing protein [Cyanobacteria bacterium FACHB-502]|nr:pentapeptide repeat-containing protein [Cyanobacteria bacterium FACHB-502]